MITNSPISCPLCGAAANPHYCAAAHRMYRCTVCTLAFVFPQPSSEELDRYYSVFHQTIVEGGEYENIERRMILDFPSKIRKIKKYVSTEDVRLIDVGCGKGFFVRACVDSGLDAKGIDLSDTAVSYATSELGIDATVGRIEEMKNVGKFDVATFWATIEHVQDPVTTLRSIYSVLRPGGLLFLDTGIGNDWLDNVLPGVNQWYDPPQHLFVFSLASISIALNKAGFVIENIDKNYERSSPRRVMRAMRAGLAGLGFRGVAEIARVSKFASNGFMLTRFPIGNLMSIVARKKA